MLKILFPDFIGSCFLIIEVYFLEFRALCTYDFCTFLHIGYTSIQLKTSVILPYGYISYKIIRRHNFSS